ncbi:MAG: DUF5105 domain-containing protein [Oscillospiraceae bacterium]
MKKKVMSGLLTLVLLLTLAACGNDSSPQTVTEKAIDAVKAVDVDATEQYWGEDFFMDMLSETVKSDPDSYDKFLTLFTHIVKNLDYQIIDTQTDGDTAAVTVRIKNVDMSQLLTDYLTQLFQEAADYQSMPEDERPSDDELDEKYMTMLYDMLDDEDAPMVINTVTVTLTKTDGQWVISPDDEVTDALLGGIMAFENNLADTLSSLGAAESGSGN